jgi:hypothetical protein
MKNVSRNRRSLWAIGAGFYILSIGLIIPFNLALALAMAFAPLIILILFSEPRAILFFLLFLLPFHAAPVMTQNILGITGFKPFNLISFAALFMLLLDGKSWRSADPLEKKSLIFLLLYLFVFAVAFLRSMANFQLFQMLMPAQFDGSIINYILTFFVKPSLYITSFLMILKVVRTPDKMEQIVSVISAGMFFLSCTVVIIGVTHAAELISGRGVVRYLTHTYLGMHYNSVGSLYIISVPLLLYKALSKQPFWITGFVLAVVAILFLQSRTTALVCLCSCTMLLILLRKRTLLITMSSIAGFALMAWVPVFIIQGLSTGFEEGTINSIFTGRVQSLWLPLLTEWSGDPMRFLFGAGRYGLMTSPLWARGFLLQASQAHNAYLDFFLDNGFLLLSALVFFLFKLLRIGWRYGRRFDSPLYWSLFLCIASFFVGAMTERQIFPSSDNILLFPVIALLINIIRNFQRGRHTDPQQPWVPSSL